MLDLGDCIQAFPDKRGRRTLEWFGLEGTFKDHLVPAMGKDILH